MTLLEGRNLRKTYRLSRHNTLEALRGVDVAIEAGEMVAIMGPSRLRQDHADARAGSPALAGRRRRSDT
jgi:hypothetical protein